MKHLNYKTDFKNLKNKRKFKNLNFITRLKRNSLQLNTLFWETLVHWLPKTPRLMYKLAWRLNLNTEFSLFHKLRFSPLNNFIFKGLKFKFTILSLVSYFELNAFKRHSQHIQFILKCYLPTLNPFNLYKTKITSLTNVKLNLRLSPQLGEEFTISQRPSLPPLTRVKVNLQTLLFYYLYYFMKQYGKGRKHKNNLLSWQTRRRFYFKRRCMRTLYLKKFRIRGKIFRATFFFKKRKLRFKKKALLVNIAQRFNFNFLYLRYGKLLKRTIFKGYRPLYRVVTKLYWAEKARFLRHACATLSENPTPSLFWFFKMNKPSPRFFTFGESVTVGFFKILLSQLLFVQRIPFCRKNTMVIGLPKRRYSFTEADYFKTHFKTPFKFLYAARNLLNLNLESHLLSLKNKQAKLLQTRRWFKKAWMFFWVWARTRFDHTCGSASVTHIIIRKVVKRRYGRRFLKLRVFKRWRKSSKFCLNDLPTLSKKRAQVPLQRFIRIRKSIRQFNRFTFNFMHDKRLNTNFTPLQTTAQIGEVAQIINFFSTARRSFETLYTFNSFNSLTTDVVSNVTNPLRLFYFFKLPLHNFKIFNLLDNWREKLYLINPDTSGKNKFIPIYETYSSAYFTQYVNRFFEYMLNSRVGVLLNFELFNRIPVREFFLLEFMKSRLQRTNSYFSTIFFVNEFLDLVYMALKMKNFSHLVNYLNRMLKSLIVWDHKRFLFFFFNVFQEQYYPLFSKLGILGIHIIIKGKVGVGGNSRKRSIRLKLDKVTRTRVNSNTYTFNNWLNTSTGALGFRVYIYYANIPNHPLTY